MRILIVEDDPLLADGICQLVRASGHNADVVGSAEDALAALRQEAFELMLLDIGLPGMDGFELLRQLRAAHNTVPVLALTARDALNEKVRGLNLGADDYLTKPFAGEELLARIAVISRRQGSQPSTLHNWGGLQVDTEGHRAWIDGQPMELPLREWAVLLFLLEHIDRVVSKERIARALCGWDQDISDNAIETYISRLRVKLTAAGLHIRTVRGIGYMLEKARG